MRIHKLNILTLLAVPFFLGCNDSLIDDYISTIEGGGQAGEEEKAPVEVLTTYEWPTEQGQAKLSEHYKVFVTVDGEEEKEIQVLQSDPIVEKYDLSGNPTGEDYQAEFTKQRSFSFVPVTYDPTQDKKLTFRVESLDGYSSSNVQISPKSYNIQSQGNGSSVAFTVDAANKYIAINFNDPNNIVLVPSDEGGAGTSFDWIKDMLCIFVDPVETLKPNPARQNIVYYSKEVSESDLANAEVIYFKPGYYNLKTDGARGSMINEHGGLTITANQKIYIAGGAFVEGYVLRRNYGDSNQAVYGRGILSGRQYMWQPGNANRLMGQLIQAGNNAVFDGVIVMESPHHGIVPTDNATFTNVKFLGWHCNNDGLRPGLNSKISNCFIRACDDFFYNYTLDVKDCVLWPAFNGSILTNGWQYFDIGGSVFDNIDIIFPEWLSMGNNKGLIMSQNEYSYNPPVGAPTTVLRNIRFEGKIPGFVNLKPNSNYDDYDPSTGKNPEDADKIPLTSKSDLGWMGDILLENVSIEEQVGDNSNGMKTNLITGATTVGNTNAPIVKNDPTAIWWVKDITFRNVTIGGVKITNENKDTWFRIDPETTKNINFE